MECGWLMVGGGGGEAQGKSKSVLYKFSASRNRLVTGEASAVSLLSVGCFSSFCSLIIILINIRVRYVDKAFYISVRVCLRIYMCGYLLVQICMYLLVTVCKFVRNQPTNTHAKPTHPPVCKSEG